MPPAGGAWSLNTGLPGKSWEILMNINISYSMDFPGGSAVKKSACQCRRHGFSPWVGKIPWRRKWQPTPVFLPGESHGQRSLEGYSSWGHKESDTT